MESLDPIALASAIGGLLLIPDNLHHVHRFEVAASMVLAGHARGRGEVTRTRVRRVIDEMMNQWTGHNDDPWPTVATEAFVHHGGTSIFVPGGIDTMFILRAVALAIEKYTGEHERFRQRAIQTVQFACRLSTNMLGAIEATRNQAVPPPTGIAVPPEVALQRLCNAVHFDVPRFERIRRASAIADVDCERFISTVGISSEPHPLDSHLMLSMRPLVRRGDDVVAIAPHLLAEAAIRNVLALARELDASHDLARAFHGTTWEAVDDAVQRLGMKRLEPPRGSAGPTPGMHVVHSLYLCDRDKVHHLMLMSDALDGEVGDRWDVSAMEGELRAAQSRLGQLLAHAEPPITEWNSIVVAAGIGRDFSTSLAHGDVRCWTISAADLESIAHAESPDPLLLWKYMEATDELRETTRIISMGPLDTYTTWNQCDRRFVEDIGALPTHLVVGPGLAEVTRRQGVTKLDWHAVPSWIEGGLVEVAIAEDPERPIYAPRRPPPNRLAMVVERHGLVVWLLSRATGSSLEDRQAKAHVADLVRMAAYWLSEFTLPLEADLYALDAQTPIVVEIGPDDGERAEPYRIVRSGEERLDVFIGARFYEAYDATNRAEREFAADISAAVLEAAGLENANASVRALLDSVAPIGVKRIVHAVNADRRPSFATAHELPSPRYVSDYDVHRVRRVILGDPSRLEVTVHGQAAKKWCNDAVSRLYQALRQQLANLDARDALGELLRRNEALVHEDQLRDITLSSVLACAGNSAEVRSDHMQNTSRQARAARATRFLVEHVVAEPPTGKRLLSLAELDQLLALAGEIIELGIASDAIDCKLAGPSAHVVVGALGYEIDLDGFVAALNEGHGRAVSERLELEISRVAVPGAQRPPHAEEPIAIKELSRGVKAEFGQELRDVLRFLAELQALALERSCSLFREPRATLVDDLARRLEWSAVSVDSLLAHFTLERREAFLDPPPAFSGSDIWPWRFNRGLSYLRRPLVRDSDDIICFTPGNLLQSRANLFSLLTNGSYRAHTPELRSRMGAFRQLATREFEDQVAAALDARDYIVRAQVRKIGKLRIEVARGEDIGDVDVLAADGARRRIFALECKDIGPDRMPNEIRADLETLFLGRQGKKPERSADAKHRIRLEWLRAHAQEVVHWLTGEDADGWTIEGAIVTRQPLVSPHLAKGALPVWTLAECRSGMGP